MDGPGESRPLPYSAPLLKPILPAPANFPQALALQSHPRLSNSSPLASVSMDAGSPQTPKFKDVRVPYVKQQGICV